VAERAKFLEQDRDRKESRTQSVCDLASSLSYLNARRPRNCCRLRAQIVNGRYLARITTINTIDELVNKSQCSIAKDVLDGLILDLGILDSDKAQKNVDALGS